MLRFALKLSVLLTIFTCQAYEISLLTTLLDDPGEFNVELDSGVNHRSDAFKFTSHVTKLPLPFEIATKIITNMDAHDAFILVVNLKIDPYNHGTLFSASGNTKEVLLDVWVKSGVNPAVGIRYLPINSSQAEIISFGPVRDFRLRRWNKVVVHVYRIGVFQSVVDVYVNCEKIGRRITRSVLDLFAYKKQFRPNNVEFRIAQKGYGRTVHSRYMGSMQDLRLVFKRDVDTFVAKDVCRIPFDAKNEFILSYHRALAEPVRAEYGGRGEATSELVNMIKDLRYDLTVQTAEIKYVRELVEGCELCRVTDFCAMKPCFPGVHCFNAPKSKDGFYCGNCPFGSHGDGIHCEDIDECYYNPCSVLSKCINKNPGYTCDACPFGYTGSIPTGIGVTHAATTKQICADVDECEINNGGCDKLVECKNTPGSFECGPCPSGYEGDPKIECRFKQYCDPDNPKSNPCNMYGKCIPLNDGKEYRCECRIGFAGNGASCGYDRDSDGYPDKALDCKDKNCLKDNCPYKSNPDQKDQDDDGVGDVCDRDVDNDRIENEKDNCPWKSNKDQRDYDSDGIGNLCDNCPAVKNPTQEDFDEDGEGDECDEDSDGDGHNNDNDNCPLLSNADQKDTDNDGKGDVCDNCPFASNPRQTDRDSDLLGDVCDTNVDGDLDGIEDTVDNCPLVSNPEQRDADDDGVGDICDEDDDNDAIYDSLDNCPLVANKDQNDTDDSGIGDVCKGDWDGDGVPDTYDASKYNNKITFTDFRNLQNADLAASEKVQGVPVWVVRKKGTEVKQTANSDPEVAVGKHRFAGVDFNGTMYVEAKHDDDFIGFVFSYQDSSSFYAVTWKKTEQVYWIEDPFRAVGISGLQLKKVKSITGPGIRLRNALWHGGSTENEVELLWSDIKQVGWESNVKYHWRLIHRPQQGVIRLKVFKGRREFVDTGYIHDNTLAGGRMGLYVFSQAGVVWSDLSYRANDEPEDDENTDTNDRLYQGRGK
ncbi:cartilage oligomeric matrix protein-like [Dendronephthya gigantea]|uniref:cartilage oligomeric matrix protein-like n=1 Tax=Dendronephthya gigantea TaxID=151771 RepID=UPI0010698426|nr:cartilage oligomeric matrix protein-like [Dendronephthya gigantea]